MRQLFFVCWFFVSASYAQVQDPILFQERVFDFGDVSEEAGPAVHEFMFTNTTARAVRILSVQASCGCTTPAWTREPVEPGKTGFIKAAFDPRGRPGYFNKTLTVTSDASAAVITLVVKGTVVKGEAPVNSADFQIAAGSLRFRTKSFNLGKVFINKPLEKKKFVVRNDANQPVRILEVRPAAGWVVDFPQAVQPGVTAELAVGVNAAELGQYGFQTGHVEITTDDPEQPVKNFALFATVEESFPTLTADEVKTAPVLGLETLTLEFGRIKSGTTVDRAVWLKNAGKKDLQIRALQANCTCVTATVEKTLLKPGEMTRLRVVFNTEGRKYLQRKAITIYSTDPRTPVQRLTITANVAE
ncbi:MAG: DUF1573 domain-containing protein [Cyclobacteriaceae bacterium]